MPFESESFTKTFSISVLEHIPDDGDTECIREIARTLAPGGRCVLTVPFGPTGSDEFRAAGDFYWSARSKTEEGGDRVFFQRRYDEADLYDRLIDPSGLTLRSVDYVGETFPMRSGELAAFLPAATGVLQPLLSRAFLTPPVSCWQELRKPLAARLVLEKTH